MDIIRADDDVTSGFVITTNEVAQNGALSLRARGLHQLIRSFPPGWRCTADEVAQRWATEGRDAVRAAMAELERARLVRREKYRDEGGRWRTNLTVYARPQSGPAEDVGADPVTEHPAAPDSPPLGSFPKVGRLVAKTAGRDQDGKPGVGKPGVGKPGVINKTEIKTEIKAGRQVTDLTSAAAPNAAEAAPACLPVDVSNTDRNRGRRRGEHDTAPAAPDSAGAALLARLPERLATPQVIRQHHRAVSALLAGGWSADALYRRLCAECDGQAGPGRLVRAIRDTPPAPPVRVVGPTLVVHDSGPRSAKKVAAPDSPAKRAALEAARSAGRRGTVRNSARKTLPDLRRTADRGESGISATSA
ncbi:hypothetical protein [Nocardia paucivorans]|uniref:hypothetical protein n=1 Tax=Nocardia paucivorans TaxID=114259 RepID=UPI00030A3AD8|nr:hypothetical protein [Nocardia paucivorans]